MTKMREGFLNPPDRCETRLVEKYSEHFSRRGECELSRSDMELVCECFADVYKYMVTANLNTLLLKRELPLLLSRNLFDAHMAILCGKRLSVMALRPFLDRLKGWTLCVTNLFGPSSKACQKLIKELSKKYEACTLSPEFELFLCISHYFKETDNGYTTAGIDARRLNEARAVEEAQAPVVLVALHNQEGKIESYSLHVSGIRVWTCSSAGEAFFYYFSLYIAFHVRTANFEGEVLPEEESVLNKSGTYRGMSTQAKRKRARKVTLTTEFVAHKFFCVAFRLGAQTTKQERHSFNLLASKFSDYYMAGVTSQENTKL